MKLRQYLLNSQQNLRTLVSGEDFNKFSQDVQVQFRSELNSVEQLLNSMPGDGADSSASDVTPLAHLLQNSQTHAQSLAKENAQLRLQMNSMVSADQVQAKIDAEVTAGNLIKKDTHEQLLQSARDAAEDAAKTAAEAEFTQKMEAKNKAGQRLQMLQQSNIPAPAAESILEQDDAAWTVTLNTAKQRHKDLVSKGMRSNAKAMETLLYSADEEYTRMSEQFLDAIKTGRGANPGRIGGSVADPLVGATDNAGSRVGLSGRMF